MDQQSLQSKKQSLVKERDKIKIILARRARKDPKVQGNYITNFQAVSTDDVVEVEDQVFEDIEYETDLDIEHVLEKRLQTVEAELQNIQDLLQKTN